MTKTIKRKTAAASKTMLDRDALLSLKGGPSETVRVPQLRGSLRVAAISAGARDAFELALSDLAPSC